MPLKQSSRVPSQRQLRVGELIRKSLSDVFIKSEIQDTDLAGVTIIVSEVAISPDIRSAKVFVSVFGSNQLSIVTNALNRHKKFLRGELARRVELKFIPSLDFRLDSSYEYSNRIDQVLKSEKVAQDLDTNT